MTVETLVRPDSMANVIADVEMPCVTHDPELWFADHPAAVAQAQSVCRTCPLRVECLAGALAREEPWGIWGGEVFEGGRIVARRRRPGRPRKDDAALARAASNALAARLAGYGEADYVMASGPGMDETAGLADYHESSETAA